MILILLPLVLLFSTCSQVSSLNLTSASLLLDNSLTESEYIYSVIRGKFGRSPWLDTNLDYNNQTLARTGRKLGAAKGARLWPNARVPYEFAPTIDFKEWQTMQLVFSNISSVTNIEFVPRTARDTDFLLVTEDIDKYGCGCCSIGLGYLSGSGAHVLVLAPVAKGGCGVNHVGGTHELLHIMGLAHTQNRADRCNYIDVNTNLITGWGEWRVGQLTGAADWFELRIPYDCSSLVHYYQLQGSFWKKEIEKKVDQFMEKQGCENDQRGRFVNACLVDGGHTEGNRIIKEGYEMCLDRWEDKHKKCVDNVVKRFPTFNNIDPNGRCKANGINRSKRKSYELSQWDIWALNAAYGGSLPPCQQPKKVGDGKCDAGNNNLGCGYDGGDCCLPEANARDCIDPCGVRLKFYGGRNRPCRKAPVSKEFCADHYWYGPNKCEKAYCSATDEKYLQWQCKNTCNLCNTDPSAKEMDKICNAFLGPEVRAKYNTNIKPQKGKPTKPNKKIPTNNTNKAKTTRKPNRKEKTKTTRRPTTTRRPITTRRPTTTRRPSTTRRPTTAKRPISKRPRPTKNKPKQNKGKFKPAKQNNINTKTKQNKTKPSRNSFSSKKEAPRSSGGFVVVTDSKRRAELRSFWVRKG